MSLSCMGRVRQEWSRHGHGGMARTKGPRQERALLPPDPLTLLSCESGEGEDGRGGRRWLSMHCVVGGRGTGFTLSEMRGRMR